MQPLCAACNEPVVKFTSCDYVFGCGKFLTACTLYFALQWGNALVSKNVKLLNTKNTLAQVYNNAAGSEVFEDSTEVFKMFCCCGTGDQSILGVCIHK